MKECIVVLGMHRSGTSILSGLVSLQGYYLGVSEMPLREDNPKGFFENHAIYRFNQQILEDHETSWDDYSFTFDKIKTKALRSYELKAKKIIKKEFGVAKRIFIKDPRMCLLFPLWEKVLEALGYKIKVIYAFRSPMEVALSLKARNDFVLEKSLLLWSHYCFQAERNSRSFNRMIVHYAQDFIDLNLFVKTLSGFLEVELTDEIKLAAHDLYTPKLKHHKVGIDNISDEVPAYLRDFVTILKNGKINQTKKLDKIIDEFYLSQELFLYDDAFLRKNIESLESQKKQLGLLHSDTLKLLEISKKENENIQKNSNLKLEEVEENLKLKIKEVEENSRLKIKEAEKQAKLALEEVQKYSAEQLKKAQLEFEHILNENKKLEKRLGKTEDVLKTLHESSRSKEEKLKAEIENKDSKIKSSYEQLAIGNQLFTALQSSSTWNKKFSRLLPESRYFKIMRAFYFFASKEKKAFIDDKILIVKSGLFSPYYYLTRYPKAWNHKVDSLNFFNKHGWKEGQNPSSHFDTRYYLKTNPDVKKSGENPLLHYIRVGKSEGRLPKPLSPQSSKLANVPSQDPSRRESNKPSLASSVRTFTYFGPTKGGINTVADGIVSGWFVSKVQHSIPIVKINGFPANTIDQNLVCLNTPSDIKHDAGFKAKVYSSINNKANVELLMLSEKGVASIANKVMQTNVLIPNKYSDLEKALSISKKDNAVAITVWEGAHNPIGRAKVLYDIVASKRPVIIFAYIFGSFGSSLWEPLRSTGMNVVLIPYAERYSYQAYIQKQNIKFDTVWICKHRLHSFELASFISKPNTACILDMDDNENVFVSSKASEFKPYGIFSKNKANYYLDRVKTRSVASISIQKEYGGEIVRHARKAYDVNYIPVSEEKVKTAVFIGTIRPHKNVTDLVEAISKFNKFSSEKIKLAIGGDFNPPSLKETLNKEDTIILDTVASNDLFDTLATYDIVITGYPDKKNESAEINKFQITSKIGDGLAVGLPVLTPDSPSVNDLHSVPGLFIFTKNNFSEQLKAAIAFTEEVKLPKQFTIDYSYKTFKSLENKAKKESRAKEVFELEPMYEYINNPEKGKKNIVLVWKQHDSGVYGRRIDHIARYYKQLHPDTNVTVIEAITESRLKEMESSKSLFDNLTIILNDVLSQKICSYSQDGVEYRLITYNDLVGWNSFDQKFDTILSSEGIYPHNSVMILFPILDVFDELVKVVKEYKVIVDLVDNQLKWMKTSKARLKGLKQYYELISIADEVVANSPENIKYFKDLNFFKNNAKPRKIANWYTLPKSFSFKRNINTTEINLIYSGNLNNRIDWSLFKDICKAIEPYNGYLHIAGTTERSAKEMQGLLKYSNCIYHGVINEKQLLRLLQHINFAVIPHVEDHISKFMDPIKLKMYKKLRITSLCSQLPGLPEDDPMLIVADSRTMFLNKLDEMLKNIGQQVSACDSSSTDEIGDQYMSVINSMLN